MFKRVAIDKMFRRGMSSNVASEKASHLAIEFIGGLICIRCRQREKGGESRVASAQYSEEIDYLLTAHLVFKTFRIDSVTVLLLGRILASAGLVRIHPNS
jgi:hypothetical protein